MIDLKKEILSILKKRKWDIKEWSRAVKIEQWALEQLITQDFSTITEKKQLDFINDVYIRTKNAKKNTKLMRFSQPVIILLWAHKGGTGKTTTAINFSYELSSRGYNTLAIDTDSQCDMTSVLYPEFLNSPDKSFFYAFSMFKDFKKDDYICHTDYKNLDIVPGSTRSDGLERILSNYPEDMKNKWWNSALSTVMNDNYYDFIIIDEDRFAGLLNMSILSIADYVLVPLEPPIFSVKSFPIILSNIEEMKKENAKLELLGMIFNKVDMRMKRKFTDSLEIIEELAPGKVFKNYINMDANIDSSQREFVPLGYYSKKSIANKQMVKLTDEILERVKERRM